MDVPIAIPTVDGPSVLQRLRTPIVGGSGASLPGLLGLKTLEEGRAILDIRNKTLYLCGKGESTITVPAGSIAIPLERAPSGHLVILVDDYANLRPKQIVAVATPGSGSASSRPARNERADSPQTI